MTDLTTAAARFAHLADQLNSAITYARDLADQADAEFDAIIDDIAGHADDDERSRIRDAAATLLGYTAVDHLIGQLQ